MLQPEHCTDMREVRASVDALDRQIVGLLAQRFRFMEAAARIKPDRKLIRDERRKAEVLANAAALATALGAPAGRIVALYDVLVESSIAFELARFDQQTDIVAAPQRSDA